MVSSHRPKGGMREKRCPVLYREKIGVCAGEVGAGLGDSPMVAGGVRRSPQAWKG